MIARGKPDRETSGMQLTSAKGIFGAMVVGAAFWGGVLALLLN